MGRVLLVEDDLDVGQMLQASLREIGFPTEWSRRFRDAWFRIEHGNHEVVVADLRLPDGDGTEIVLLATRRGKKVILITSDLGACGTLIPHEVHVLRKPFPVSALIELIEREVGPSPVHA